MAEERAARLRQSRAARVSAPVQAVEARWAVLGLPRILRTTTGSVSCAMRRWGPPQCGQVRTSTEKTRRRSSAHVERDERGRAEVLGAVGEMGAEAACEWATGRPKQRIGRICRQACVRRVLASVPQSMRAQHSRALAHGSSLIPRRFRFAWSSCGIQCTVARVADLSQRREHSSKASAVACRRLRKTIAMLAATRSSAASSSPAAPETAASHILVGIWHCADRSPPPARDAAASRHAADPARWRTGRAGAASFSQLDVQYQTVTTPSDE